jgi:two-component system, LytTR family, sensor kinase
MNWLLEKRFYYLVFGLIFFIFWFLFKVGGFADIPSALLSTLFDAIATMAVLITTLEILLPKFVYKKKYKLFFLCYGGMIFSGGSMIILTQLQLLGQNLFSYQKYLAQYEEHYFYWFWADLIFGSFILVFFVSSVGAAVRLAFERIKETNKVEQLEKEKVMTALEILKDQLNPHFLFNALNTIYYKIDRTNTDGRETLQRFSDMLRYQLYECNKKFVEIENELSFIQTYIELQKERLNKNYCVGYEGFETVKDILVSPFLLLPLVENCFKHVSDYPEKENTITIKCSMKNDIFYFITLNTITAEPGNNENGIGLENIKKRLQLIYPDKHELTISKRTGFFEVELQLACIAENRL